MWTMFASSVDLNSVKGIQRNSGCNVLHDLQILVTYTYEIWQNIRSLFQGGVAGAGCPNAACLTSTFFLVIITLQSTALLAVLLLKYVSCLSLQGFYFEMKTHCTEIS